MLDFCCHTLRPHSVASYDTYGRQSASIIYFSGSYEMKLHTLNYTI